MGFTTILGDGVVSPWMVAHGSYSRIPMTVGESLRASSRKLMLPRGVPIEQEFPALLGPLLEGGTHPALVLWHFGLPKWGHHQKGRCNILPWGDCPVTLVTRVALHPRHSQDCIYRL